MIEILNRQVEFPKNQMFPGSEREIFRVVPQQEMENMRHIKSQRLPLSQRNSPLFFDTKWAEDAPISPRKGVKIQFLSSGPKYKCNHERVKSENLDQMLKEDLDELHNKISLHALKYDKHRNSINAIVDTFSQKKWIHKQISSEEKSINSVGKSEQSSLNSSSLDLESSIEIKDDDRNAWIKSARSCDADGIFSLLTRNTHLVNCADHIFGYTGLHWAAKKGRDDIISMLLTSGGLIDIRSVSGSTPLHLATQSGKWNVVELLVTEFNADIRIRDNNSRRAFDYLKQNAPPRIFTLLQSKSILQVHNETQTLGIENEIAGKGKKSTLKKLTKGIKKIHNSGGSSEA